MAEVWKGDPEVSRITQVNATHCEVDEWNIIRGIHTTPPANNGSLNALTSYSISVPEQLLDAIPDRAASPIMWRKHNEVALEMTKYKQALCLHDLVHDNNPFLMVAYRGHILIQGLVSQVCDMWEKWRESFWKGTGMDFLKFSSTVTCRSRAHVRFGGLVDIKYNMVDVEWRKGKRLLGKTFPRVGNQTIVLLEVRNADISPAGELRPGRRLVPIEEATFP